MPTSSRCRRRNLAQASEGCRAKFDRAFMQILLDRLSMANLRLSV